ASPNPTRSKSETTRIAEEIKQPGAASIRVPNQATARAAQKTAPQNRLPAACRPTDTRKNLPPPPQTTGSRSSKQKSSPAAIHSTTATTDATTPSHTTTIIACALDENQNSVGAYHSRITPGACR